MTTTFDRYQRLVNTGIRREWLGKNFIMYVLMLGGEFRKFKMVDLAQWILWVPEAEWLGLRDEYLRYEKGCDKHWKPIQ